MARFFADISYPDANVVEIRKSGPEVITCWEAGIAVPPRDENDPETKLVAVKTQLSFAKQHGLILLTENWWDYRTFRWTVAQHAGIVCTIPETPPDVVASLIQGALGARDEWENRFVVVRTEAAKKEADLSLAATTGKLDQVKQLLNSGVKIDESGALHNACYRGHPAVVSLLLASHADLNLVDNDGMTPLMVTCGTIYSGEARRGFGSYVDYFEIVRLLLDHGADVNAQDKEGKTALDHTLTHGINGELVEFLLAKGANQDLPDRGGVSFQDRLKESLEEAQND